MTRLKEDRKQQEEALKEFGHNTFGPVMLEFQAWLADQAAREGVTRLHFLSREGYFLQRLYDTFKTLGLAPAGAPDSSYLLASRRLVFGAARKTPESLKYMLAVGPFHGKLHQLLEGRLGVDGNELGVADSEVEMPRHADAVVGKLLPFLPKLNEIAERERAPLLAYLRSAGFEEGGRVGLVDLGYSGSIQRYLYEVSGVPMTGFYFATTKAAEEWQQSRNKVLSCFGTGCGPDTKLPVYRYSLALESWLTSPDGQVLHFGDNGQALYGPAGEMQEKFWIPQSINDGVEGYFNDIATLDRCGAHWRSGLDAVSQPLMESVLKGGRYEEQLEMLHVQDFFVGEGEISVASKISAMV